MSNSRYYWSLYDCGMTLDDDVSIYRLVYASEIDYDDLTTALLMARTWANKHAAFLVGHAHVRITTISSHDYPVLATVEPKGLLEVTPR